MARACALLRFVLLGALVLLPAAVAEYESRAENSTSSRREPVMASIDPLATATHCNITGQCVQCTQEQQDEEPSCRATGFHQEITCIESYSSHSGAKLSSARGSSQQASVRSQGRSGSGAKSQKSEDDGDDGGAGQAVVAEAKGVSKKKSTSRSLLNSPQVRRILEASEEKSSDDGAEEKASDGAAQDEGEARAATKPARTKTFSTFEACMPVEEETLSVLGFEAIVLSLLAACAPLVYQRKRKATVSIALTRLPSNSRA